MSRTIILPQEIEDKLQALTSLKEESNGILLYRRQGDLCPIEALYMTGVGSPGHVQADPEKMEVANQFFKTHSDYRCVKFHTHTKGTIAQFGEQYAREFSEKDIEGIQEQLHHDREFIAMLVTPEKRLLSGIDNPQLHIVDHSEDYEKNHEFVETSLKGIADDLEIGHERFRGTRLS